MKTRFEPEKGPGKRVMPQPVARALKELMLEVVDQGTGRRVKEALHAPDGAPIPIGGKTGSRDNRYQAFTSGGRVGASRSINRTASFVFVIGDHFFGMVSAYVPGPEAAHYRFTSSLALQTFKTLAPTLEPLIAAGEGANVAAAAAREPERPQLPRTMASAQRLGGVHSSHD